MEPFNPSYSPFLRTMFIMPAIPSGSYLADGEVMTSTFSIRDAGILSMSPPCLFGRPFNNILTFRFPLKDPCLERSYKE